MAVLLADDPSSSPLPLLCDPLLDAASALDTVVDDGVVDAAVEVVDEEEEEDVAELAELATVELATAELVVVPGSTQKYLLQKPYTCCSVEFPVASTMRNANGAWQSGVQLTVQSKVSFP